MKVYIIYLRSLKKYRETSESFNKAQLLLKKSGFTVTNTINKNNLRTTFSNKVTVDSLKKLSTSDAVFILPEVNAGHPVNTELKIAFELNLFLMHGCAF